MESPVARAENIRSLFEFNKGVQEIGVDAYPTFIKIYILIMFIVGYLHLLNACGLSERNE